MRVLVSGGAGFQGSHLVSYLLENGHQVTILNTLSATSEKNITSFKNKVNLIWGSITDREIVEKTVREHDLVVHLAARIHVDESIEEPNAYLDVNIGGTYNFLEAVKKNNPKARFIYWGTCEVYGEPASKRLTETAELRPQSPYAASKAAADRLCYAYFRTYGLNITIARFFNIYGERQKSGARGALIPTLVERAMSKESLIISGSGEQSRDYLNISDVISAFEILLKSKKTHGETLNFATGVDTKIKDIAQYIAKRFNVGIVHGKARPGEVMTFSADITRAKLLGFTPKVKIWDGIDRYINWRLSQ